MKKIFLSIGIVLLAMVVLVGCEDGSTVMTMSEGDQEILLFEAMFGLATTVSPPRTGNSYTFDITLPDEYDADFVEDFLSSPQFIGSGTRVQGQVTVTGATFDVLYNEESTLDADTEISLIYNLTFTGNHVPDGTKVIEIIQSGEYGSSIEDIDFTVRIDGQLTNLDYPDLGL